MMMIMMIIIIIIIINVKQVYGIDMLMQIFVDVNHIYCVQKMKPKTDLRLNKKDAFRKICSVKTNKFLI